jgi:thioredoxin reductase (NADPH)/glutaredoxin 3
MQAILYTKDDCQECDRARMLLTNLNISHLEYKLQKDFDEKQFYAEFGKDAFFPQIAIDYKHVGGLKEALQYFKDRKII